MSVHGKIEAECATIEARRAPRRTERKGGNGMFRGARHSDLEQILDIYARARKVMAASGNPTQWGDGYPPRRCWKRTSTPTGCSSIRSTVGLRRCSPSFWGRTPTYAKIEGGKWLNDTLPYGTIHRLASAGHRKGVTDEVITLVSRALREPARRHPRGQQDHAASSARRTALPAAASS